MGQVVTGGRCRQRAGEPPASLPPSSPLPLLTFYIHARNFEARQFYVELLKSSEQRWREEGSPSLILPQRDGGGRPVRGG